MTSLLSFSRSRPPVSFKEKDLKRIEIRNRNVSGVFTEFKPASCLVKENDLKMIEIRNIHVSDFFTELQSQSASSLA